MDVFMGIAFAICAGWLIAVANYGVPGPIALIVRAARERTGQEQTQDTDAIESDYRRSDVETDDESDADDLSVSDVPLLVELRNPGEKFTNYDPYGGVVVGSQRPTEPARSDGAYGAVPGADGAPVTAPGVIRAQRRAAVRERMAEGWQTSKIIADVAPAFGVSDKTIIRDITDIRRGK